MIAVKSICEAPTTVSASSDSGPGHVSVRRVSRVKLGRVAIQGVVAAFTLAAACQFLHACPRLGLSGSHVASLVVTVGAMLTTQTSEDDQLSGADLLQRYLEGDNDAFTLIVDRYRKELYSFLVRFIGDPALADDVFQETFLQLHLSAARFKADRRLKPWLFTIAANKARDAMRARSRRQAAPLDKAIANHDADRTGSYLDLMPSQVPAPGEALADSETQEAVKAILDQMPEHLRAVLLLCYYQELSYKDIAEILGVPLGTVKSRLHAAVRYFAERWNASADQLEPEPAGRR